MSSKQFHVNNTEISPDLSDKYSPINTKILLAPFLNNGWDITSQKQFGELGKEITVLNHPDFLYDNGDSLNITSMNSFDGTGALVLMGGYGRIVCSNGLLMGDVSGGRFVHRGDKIYERIEHQYESIVAHLNVIRDRVDKLKEVDVSDEQQVEITKNVLKRLFEKDTKKQRVSVINVSPYNIRNLTRVRRGGDRGTDAFTRLNVLQENIIRLGRAKVVIETVNKETNEAIVSDKSLRRSEDKLSSVRINKIISEEYLKLVG